MDEKAVWDLPSLLSKLQSEHHPHYVYRGQNLEFVPLVPSLYRGFINTAETFERGNIISLRNTGRYFYQTHNRLEFSDSFKRQFSFGKMAIGLFGLPLGMFFCQHCCIPTEGIDVTEDFLIAFLFAIYDYRHTCYFSDYNKLGVMYRITIPDTKFDNLKQIKEIDSYTCPFYLNGKNILGVLGECDTIDQAIESYRQFQFEDYYLKTQTDIDESCYMLHRPLEVLKLPRRELEKGRVFRQHAGLLNPDMIFDQKFDVKPNRQDGIPWKGNFCIEDLSKNEYVEIFHFHHSVDNRRLIDLDPRAVFPEKDLIRSLLLTVLTGLGGISILHWDDEQDIALMSGDEEGIVQ